MSVLTGCANICAMAKYNLQPNEVVLLKDDSVMHGSGFMSGYTDELILTNLNLVLTKKGTFGNSKGVRTFPVNQIKVYNQQAQARLGEARNGSALLEVYFLSGEEQFTFQGGGKKKVLTWVAKINEVVTGHAAPEVAGGTGLALPGAELVAGVLKDTLGVFKSKRGSKSAPVQIAAKCQNCGAPVAGLQGQQLTCAYCGSAQQL
jgi:hypothetical protein